MRIKANPVEELAKKVNEKARELQNAQESVDSATRKISELQQHEQGLRRDIERLEIQINEKQSEFNALIEKEYRFISEISQSASREKERLDQLKRGVESLSSEQTLLSLSVDDARSFAAYRDEYKSEYLQWKQKSEKAEQDYISAVHSTNTLFRDSAVRQKDMDHFKQNLTEFYGKVASYVRVAKDTLEYVNNELERKGTPVRFNVPKGEILEVNLENFI